MERMVYPELARVVTKPTCGNNYTMPQPFECASAGHAEEEAKEWVVLGVDRSRLVTFCYNSVVAPTKLIVIAHLKSRRQLDELISAGIQGLWNDLPMETKQQYRKADSIRFSPNIDPMRIIERGKQILAQEKREKGSMRAEKVETALRVEPQNDWDGWKVRDARVHPYGASFAEVMPVGSLSSLVESGRHRTGKGLVLDFMGYGQVLRDLPITGGLAVALGDPRSEQERQYDAKRNIAFVEGNVLKRSTWNEIQRWLNRQETNDKKFDLILSRPVRGLDDLTDHKGVNLVLLQRGWQMLSSQNGVLLTQFLEQVFEPELVDRWVTLLNQTKGIKASYSLKRNPECEPIAFRPALSLVKGEGAPTKLPLLTLLTSEVD